MIKAIETRYKGYRFRSRLEARWAVFFDALGVRWEYEREGYELPSGRYLPDFFVHWDAYQSPRLHQFREVGYWVEIKGTSPTEDELRKLLELSDGSGHIGYLFQGHPWECECWVVNPSRGDHKHAIKRSLGGTHFLRHSAVVDCCPRVSVSKAVFDKAIARAREARFEHGETPETSMVFA